MCSAAHAHVYTASVLVGRFQCIPSSLHNLLIVMASVTHRLSLMSDWDRSLKENEGVAWVTCRKLVAGEKNLEGELRSQGVNANGQPVVTASEGFMVSEVTKRRVTVSCPDRNVTTQFVAPNSCIDAIHDKSIHSLDISAGGALGVSASSDGHLRIWETSSGIVRRELEGHAGEAETCRFFPSGMVVLSGGLDTQLKIWSVEDGSCPVTLTGHKRGIQDTAIVDRGRNVVSCSLDGSARLWDCGQAQCLGVIGQGSDAINGCALAPVADRVALGSPESAPSEREVGSEGKLLVLGREGGTLEGHGLRSRQKIFSVIGSAAFNCCAFLSSQLVAGGTQDGNIYLVDVRNTSTAQAVIHQSASPVKCMMGCKDGFLAGTNDGGCFFFSLQSGLQQEFTGSDFDPIYAMARYEDFLYTACRDHVIRKYAL